MRLDQNGMAMTLAHQALLCHLGTSLPSHIEENDEEIGAPCKTHQGPS